MGLVVQGEISNTRIGNVANLEIKRDTSSGRLRAEFRDKTSSDSAKTRKKGQTRKNENIAAKSGYNVILGEYAKSSANKKSSKDISKLYTESRTKELARSKKNEEDIQELAHALKRLAQKENRNQIQTKALT